jgi:hypothetical protein
MVLRIIISTNIMMSNQIYEFIDTAPGMNVVETITDDFEKGDHVGAPLRGHPFLP